MQAKSEYREYSKKDFFIVFSVILVSKSLYYESYGGNYLLIGLFFLLSFLIIPNIKNLKIEKIILLYIFGLLALILINLETSYRSVFVLVNLMLIGIMIIHLVSFERFSKAFIKIMLILCIISWPALLVIQYDLNSPLPNFSSVHYIEDVRGRTLKNFIFFGVDEGLIKYTILRTSSIWWEPGAFQVFINLAVIFSLISNSLSMKRYAIFAITILTSMSTTGILAFTLLSLIFFEKYLKFKNNLTLYLIPLFILVLGSIFIGPIIFEKMSGSHLSFLSRYHDIVISINMFADNFFLGYGYGTTVEKKIPYGEDLLGYDLYWSSAPSASDGITGFIAQVGVLGFIFMYPFLFPRYCKHLKLSDSLLISLSLLIIFNTQNFTNILIFTVLTFYALIDNEKNKPKEIKNIFSNTSS